MNKKPAPALPFYWLTSGTQLSNHRMRVDLPSDDYQEYEWRCWEAYAAAGHSGDYPLVTPPSRSFVATFANCGKCEDMPWCPEEPVVSARLWRLLTSMQPEGLNAIPLNGQCEGDTPPHTEYVCVHASLVVECHDVARSHFNTGAAWNNLRVFVIDPARVPPDVHVFRPRYMESRTIISHAVREAMEAAGMTGCPWFSSDSLDLSTVFPDG
ncbi:MAG: hypothetical protein K2Q20_12165 [Phycisphaerales bacterium]|nr:hypothetical protein [Phycisphaerales bacterium]